MQFVVKQNRSLSWHGNKLFILNVGILSLGIAVLFAFQGLWLILPFAGLEVLALTAGLYIVSLRCTDQEVINITDDYLTIEKGRQTPKQRWQFQRPWVSVELQNSSLRGHPNKLLLSCKGQQLEVAKCLSNKERKELADSLKLALNKPIKHIE